MRNIIKYLLFLVALFCSNNLVMAQNIPTLPSELTIGGIPQLLANKLAESRAAALVDLSGNKGAAVYLPIWKINSADKSVVYAHAANIGYRGIEGQKPNVLIMPLALNLPAVSAKLWNFTWAKIHLERSEFPPIFVGPTVLLPVNGPDFRALTWNGWRSWTGIVFSVGLK